MSIFRYLILSQTRISTPLFLLKKLYFIKESYVLTYLLINDIIHT